MNRLILALLTSLVATVSFAKTTLGDCGVYAGAGTGTQIASAPTIEQCASAVSAPGAYTLKTPMTIVSDGGDITLAVAGEPTLPYTGTTNRVTVGFKLGTPTKVELSRDGYAAFATWCAQGTVGCTATGFFTLAADARSIAGDWCTQPTCWGSDPTITSHTLTAVASFPDGTKVKLDKPLTVKDAVTPPTPSTGGVTAAMWAEWATQRAAFGDPNDCKARFDAIPKTGYSLPPGGNIAAALASNKVVVLQTGVYRPSVYFTIPTGAALVAAPGAKPVIDASAITNWWAIGVGSSAFLSGVEVVNSRGWGVTTFHAAAYTNSGTINAVTVHDSGMTANAADNGTGIVITGGAKNWCVIDSEVYNTFNLGGSGATSNGGNSDGIANNFGAANNSFIFVRAHNNGDDGFDMWQGGQSYWYFSTASDNGKVPGKAITGDGNGIKLGTGSVSHKFYKTFANNNKKGGWNLNGNTMQPTLVQSGASGNPAGNYMNGVIAP